MACEFNDELTKRIQEELGHKGGENAWSYQTKIIHGQNAREKMKIQLAFEKGPRSFSVKLRRSPSLPLDNLNLQILGTKVCNE
jgi:hypothetical protein